MADVLASEVYRLAQRDDDRAVYPLELATRALGATAIRYEPRLEVPGMLAPVRGKWRLYLRSGLTRRRLAHVVGHELGHWVCQREGVEDTEDLCDAIGAAIVAPRRAYLNVVARRGACLRNLAWYFATSETLVALRYAETTGIPLALITPRDVRLRGKYDWPPENELRALAQSGGGDGLRAVRLRDDPRRIALTSCALLAA